MQTLNGYELQTTLFEDFQIAMRFGTNAVKDTYKRVMREWGKNYVYVTELVLALNWVGWICYDEHNEELSDLFFSLFEEAQEYAETHLKGEELSFYYEVTD